MDRFDPRIVRVGVEVNGEVRVYEDLDITVSGSKVANPIQNTCTVTISNLTRDVRNYLLTETSPFNANRTPKRLFVEVGRLGDGPSRIFTGEIVTSAPTQPPDIGLTLTAKTGAFAAGQVVARSGTAQQALSSLAARVAADLSLTLDFRAQDKQIANYAFNGPMLRQVQALELAGGVDAYVDDETLVVKDRGAPLTDRTHVLSAQSGMIGIPEATERGVKVQMMLDAKVTVGGGLTIESALNPAMNGAYTIYKLDFEAATRDQPFYWTAEASRNGYTPPPEAADA